MKLYYQDEAVTLYHGDALYGLGPDGPLAYDLRTFDLAVVDPPYNVGKEYGQHDDLMSPELYARWCGEWWPMLRYWAPRVALFCGHGNIPMWYRIEKPAAIGCWYKPGNPASSILGHVEWEPWLYWHGGDKGLLGGSDVLRAPISSGDGFGHPCPKPVGLISKLIVKARGLEVLDPFAGVGTTLVAAKAQGRRAVGIEIEERFCETAAKRLSQGVLDFGDAA